MESNVGDVTVAMHRVESPATKKYIGPCNKAVEREEKEEEDGEERKKRNH